MVFLLMNNTKTFRVGWLPLKKAMWGIVNRAKASVDGFAYSGALANFGGDWSVEELNKFKFPIR